MMWDPPGWEAVPFLPSLPNIDYPQEFIHALGFDLTLKTHLQEDGARSQDKSSAPPKAKVLEAREVAGLKGTHSH